MNKETLALHADHPEGHEGYVLLLYRPDSEGRVRWREWSSDDYVGPPREGSSSVAEIVQRIADWGRDGWRLNESIHMVTDFLGAR